MGEESSQATRAFHAASRDRRQLRVERLRWSEIAGAVLCRSVRSRPLDCRWLALPLGLALRAVSIGGFAHGCVALEAGPEGSRDRGERAGHPGDLQVGGEA